jgi:uncharacterized NAD(P)/FAD-binding protein YdhS
MKAKFEFDLPEDQQEYNIMNQAYKMHRFLQQFSEELRTWEKYGHEFTDAQDAVSKIREEFYKILNNYQVNLDL